MGKNEKGYITVETLGTFLPFVFLVVSILSLVNIVTVQTRVHYALTQTANTLSVYAHATSGQPKNNIETVLENIGSIDSEDIKIPLEIIEYMGDPNTLVRELMGRYLSNGSLSGGEYLKSANVIGGLNGLEFGGSAIDGGEISLAVEYAIEYKFGVLPLPFGPKLKVTQQAKTRAWQGGAGEGYAG